MTLEGNCLNTEFKKAGDRVVLQSSEWNSGVIQLDQEVYVDNSVLGKMIIIKRNDSYILFEFPVANDTSNQEGIELLEKPPHSLNYKVEWGQVYQRPHIKARVKTIACYTKSIGDDDVFNILSKWRTRFIDIMEIVNECLIPKSPVIGINKYPDGSIDFYSGISMSRVLPDGRSIPIRDLREPAPITVHIISQNCYVDFNVVYNAAVRALKDEPLPQTYYLLLDAYHAFKDEEYRGAVTLGGISLEHCILEKIKAHSAENGIPVRYPIGELGRKFEKLKEFKIEVPIQNYKEEILILRNAVLHKGIQVTESEANTFLKNCRKIIDEYEPLLN